MSFYVVNILIFLIYAGLLKQKRSLGKKTAKYIIILSGIHFGLIMCFRGFRVGVDTLMYSGIYGRVASQENIVSVINSFPKYAGYAVICKVFSFFIPNSYGYMIMTGLLIIPIVWWFIYHYSNNVILSIYLYITFFFYCSSFNVSREFIAISLGLIIYYCIDRGRLIPSIVLFFISISIHSVSLVLLLLFVFKFLKMSRKSLLLTVGISVSAIFLFDRLTSVFIRYFPQYAFYDLGGAHAYSSSRWTSNGGIIIFYLIYLAVGLLGMYICERKQYDYLKTKNTFRMSILLLCAALLGLIFPRNQLVSRIVFYFSIYVIILIPNSLNFFKKSNKKKLKMAIYIIMMIPLIYLLYTNNSGVVPYSLFI